MSKFKDVLKKPKSLAENLKVPHFFFNQTRRSIQGMNHSNYHRDHHDNKRLCIPRLRTAVLTQDRPYRGPSFRTTGRTRASAGVARLGQISLLIAQSWQIEAVLDGPQRSGQVTQTASQTKHGRPSDLGRRG